MPETQLTIWAKWRPYHMHAIPSYMVRTSLATYIHGLAYSIDCGKPCCVPWKVAKLATSLWSQNKQTTTTKTTKQQQKKNNKNCMFAGAVFFASFNCMIVCIAIHWKSNISRSYVRVLELIFFFFCHVSMSDTSLSYYYIDCSTVPLLFLCSFTLMMTIWKHVHDKEHNTTQVQVRVR